MHCPKCNEKKLKVIDSRDRELHANSLIRRRECTACGYGFNTTTGHSTHALACGV